MSRATLAVVVVLLVTGVTAGNGLPPPGKSIPVEHKITTDKDYPDYNFYLVGEKLLAVKLDPKNPIELKIKAGESYSYRLVAVPKGAEKRFDTEDELRKALRKDGGVEGSVHSKITIASTTQVPPRDKRDRVTREHVVEKINAKDGIVLTSKDVEPKKDDAKKDSPDDEDAPGVTASLPRGVWVAGLSVSLAMMLGGLWLVGRTQRKV